VCFHGKVYPIIILIYTTIGILQHSTFSINSTWIMYKNLKKTQLTEHVHWKGLDTRSLVRVECQFELMFLFLVYRELMFKVNKVGTQPPPCLPLNHQYPPTTLLI